VNKGNYVDAQKKGGGVRNPRTRGAEKDRTTMNLANTLPGAKRGNGSQKKKKKNMNGTRGWLFTEQSPNQEDLGENDKKNRYNRK